MMKQTFFQFLNTCGAPLLLRKLKGDSITVLNLHRISDEEDYFYNPIRTDIFDKLLEYCYKHYEVISITDMHKVSRKPKLVLSFDDGYRDFIEYAVPILKKYDLPSNHNFVNAGLNQGSVIWTQQLNDVFNYLKNNNITDDETITAAGCNFSSHNQDWMSMYLRFFRILLTRSYHERMDILTALTSRYNISSHYAMMNWDDVQYCIDHAAVEYGSHTFNHDSLLTLHTTEELEREIGNSIDEMHHKLGKRTEILALPNGQFNDEVIQYSKNAGIKYVLLADDQLQKKNCLNSEFNLVSRIGLVRESVAETILRTELFHKRIKKLL